MNEKELIQLAADLVTYLKSEQALILLSDLVTYLNKPSNAFGLWVAASGIIIGAFYLGPFLQ